MTKKIKYFIIIVIAVAIVFSSSNINASSENILQKSNQDFSILNTSTYDGKLIIYLVEPDGRYKMSDGQNYPFVCTDIVYKDFFSYDDTNSFHITINRNPDLNVEKDNLMVIAAVFNAESEVRYSNPPDENSFDAYFLNAMAVATPYDHGFNTVTGDFTHSVLVEVGTHTRCPYCPTMTNMLDDIFKSSDYEFYFVDLIYNRVTEAVYRLSYDFNKYAYPTAYFDGGYELIIGACEDESEYRNLIETCGTREVEEMNIGVSFLYLDEGHLEIYVGIEKNPEISRPLKPYGEKNIDIDAEMFFSTSSVESNGEKMYYKWDWGDGNLSDWLGPYNSGEKASASYSWSVKKEYDIKVKGKNIDGSETSWSDPLTVNVGTKGKTKDYSSFFEIIYGRFSIFFPFIIKFLEKTNFM